MIFCPANCSSMFRRVMSTITASSLATTSAYNVAIIGGGAAGCAVSRKLVEFDSSARITIFEMGRGLGGRASTRKTRALPDLRINHGAPFADITTKAGQKLVDSLDSCTMPYIGRRGSINAATGTFTSNDSEEEAKELFVTGPGNQMSNIPSSLISDHTGAILSSIEVKYSTMVRGLSRSNDGKWLIYDKAEKEIGSFDFLVVCGSGVAHPRWSATFGGGPPLVNAAASIKDRQLDAALSVIAEQTAAPVLTVMLYCTGDMAAKFTRLDFNVGDITDSSVLARVVIQPSENNKGCSIVLHSTSEFALQNAGVYGSSSTAARVGEATSDSTREEDLIDQMLAAFDSIPFSTPSLPGAGMSALLTSKTMFEYGPLLHRWGNAFPQGTPLPEELMVCPGADVAFCGDYVSSPARVGSLESALLSGTSVAERIYEHMSSKLKQKQC